MKALTFATVCLLTTPIFSQDMAGMMATQAGIDAANAATMQQGQAAQLLLQQQAQQQALEAEQVRKRAQYAQDGQIQLPVANPTPAPVTRPILQNNQAVAPAVFYAPAAGEKTLSPQSIEVEVPVYSTIQPKSQVQKIYTEIKGSQFFLELNPLSLKVAGNDFESNEMDNGNPALEFDTNTVKARLVPLDFRFGFENEGWGSFAEVRIADGEDSSALTIYSKIAGHKFGAGLVLNSYDYDIKVKRYGASGTGAGDSVEIGPYFYASFQLSNDDSISIEQWNKIGAFYEKNSNSDMSVKGISFVFHPALDIMFKINPKLQIGTGMEFEYTRFSGDLQVSDLPKYKGIGNSYSFELNLIKTKFLF